MSTFAPWVSKPFIVGGFLCSLAWGAPQFSYEVAESFRAGEYEALTQAVQAAIRHVRAVPPAKKNPFRARTSRRVHIVLTTAGDPIARSVFEVSAESAASNDSNAFTFTVGEDSAPFELTTYIFLLVDRLCRDPETGRQRPDAFIRMLAALGHEVYGNLPTQFKLVPGEVPAAATLAERKIEESSAFTAGIAFLNRYLKSKLWEGFAEGTKGFIEAALERDRRALESWKAASPCVEAVAKKRRKK